MKARMIRLTMIITIAMLAGWAMAAADAPGLKEQRAKADKLTNDGNQKEAYEIYSQLALNPENVSAEGGADLAKAVSALIRLNREKEVDAFREKVVAVHKDHWRIFFAAAQTLRQGSSYGFIIAGEFQRGRHRGGTGRRVNCVERDRVRALQLMTQAMANAKGETDLAGRAAFYESFADMLLGNRGYNEAWRLQYLTDLSVLPDYEEGYRGRGGYRGDSGSAGAPVNPDGTPVFYKIPKTYEASVNDGERWRWMLVQAMEAAPERVNYIFQRWADFLRNQFGVQTLAEYGRYFGGGDDTKKDESGPYALHTLSDDETIARLATGIKRLTLPADFNYIRAYQRIADNPKTGRGEQALNTLAQCFEDRRQYDKAVDYWKRSIKEYGPGHDNYKQLRLDQILGNWGQFESIMAQPAGKGATVEFRFRNGKAVQFEAYRLKEKLLLDDVKAYIKTKPPRLDRQKVNIGNIGYRIVQRNEKRYLGEKVADWKQDLQPRPMHFDRRITVATPLQKAGAYLVMATMADGNTSKIVLWLDDTVIVKKPLDQGQFLFVGDAVSGQPIAKANVEFFGYRQKWVQGTKTYNILLSDSAEFTDENGQIILKAKALPANYQWLIIATTPEGRLAHLGFAGIWNGRHYDEEYNAVKTFFISDRPVYRPGQPVKFKFWIRHARYDQSGADYANKSFTVRIHDPKGEKVMERAFQTDAYGGLEGEYVLPQGAALGVYNADIPNMGNGSFRVEEYKKPEFEVKVDAPTDPVMLGEKITATVTARYYFGAPVKKGKVKYKVMRSAYNANWYPCAPWDWLYGRGYWWFAGDYTWYPGWRDWGCFRPYWPWWPAPRNPPELVAENEVAVGEDGTIKIEIDTALAKAMHGDTDHKYDITAEVTDESRRTIVGQGTVLVARKPLKVYAWVDRGHYRVGDTIRADFLAQTLASKPVKGEGSLTLFKIAYDKKGAPVETPAQKWDLDTDELGKAMVQIKASAAGQYRLAYKVVSANKQAIEGACLFCIAGEGFDGKDFRFNNIELVPDRREYAPGEKVRLMINTDRIGSTVLLFIRPVNGVGLPPKILRLGGKSAVEEIEVVMRDMPNFFVEAITISDGKIHDEIREIAVPPAKRALNVAVTPSAASYKPGAPAKVRVRLTDFFGKPFIGSMVMTIYDKALEYISGGSNVPEIKAFFWKWRRTHRPQIQSSLGRGAGPMTDPGKQGMQSIGVFGHLVADYMKSNGMKDKDEPDSRRRGALQHEVMAFKSDALNGAMVTGEGMAVPSAPASAAMFGEDKEDGRGGSAAPPAPPVVEPTVRTKFADTAFWAGALTTDSNGLAEISLVMPENLTGWNIRSWAMGPNTEVGEGDAAVTTTKDLLLRMQAPRFFVEKDEVVLSANVHNYLKSKNTVQVVLELDGACLQAMGKLKQRVVVEANGEQRVDWRVKVQKEGTAVVRMKALTDEESDAMEMKFPVYVHGMLKTDSFSGALRPDQEKGSITLTVPAERRINESRLEVRYSPTLAGALVDALPYLVNYPYGCTEQVLNRFLPAVITQKILLQMGLDLKAIQAKRTNLNAQEIGSDTERAKQWQRYDRNPVFDQDTMRAMVKEGLRHLTAMQCADGGWGWFSGYGEHSYPHTTAYVVHGLQIACENDVALVPGVLERGVNWLKNYQADQVRRLKNAATKTKPWKPYADNLDAFVFMALTDAGVQGKAMRKFLYRDRTKLAVYGMAMYGMALHKLGQNEKLAMILRNIEQFLVQDDENQTAWLNLGNGGYWWCWYGSEYEAHAYYLKLLAKTDPTGVRASRLVKYLLNNRKNATYWNSTRDTALCVEAMADYLKASKEDKPDMTVSIFVDGKQRKKIRINSSNLFTFDNKFVLQGDAVESGKHTLEFRKQGKGPLYFNAYLSIFTLEDFIGKAGLEIKVNRKYFKLVPEDKTVKVAGARGQALDQKVEKYKRVPLENGAVLKSGDLVEVELEIDSKNDYEYLVFEDMKAAGFEPVSIRSGYGGNDLGAYMELRDERVCFFVRALPRGKSSVAYRVRAEIPGKFSALPTRASAMYAPELKANSDEIKLSIED